MTKQEAISLFGNGASLARALGITRSAISQWPDDLDQPRSDMVNGAALRLGKFKIRKPRAKSAQAS
jgi:transcriptional repressor of cell division inhibition gene dicB